MSANLDINVNVRGGQAQTELAGIRAATDQVKAASNSWNISLRELSQSYLGLRALVGDVSRAVSGFAQSAIQHEQHQRAVQNLGAAYEGVRRATAGVVSEEQALRVQQQLTQAGLNVSGEALAVITRRARDYARATGEDLQQALDQLTQGLRGGTREALHNFGAQIRQNETGTQASARALQQWRDEQSRTLPATQDLAEAADTNTRAWHDFTNGMSATIAQAINLRGILNSLREATGGLGEALGNAFAEFGIGAGGGETARRNTERQTEQLRLQIAEDAARRGVGRIAGLDRLSVAQLYSIRDRLARGENPNAVVNEASGTGRAAIAADQAAASAAASRRTALISGRGGGGGGGGRPRLTAFQRLEQQTEAFGRADSGGDDEFFQGILSATDRPANNQSTALSADAVASIEASRQRERDLADARRQQQELSDVGRQMNRSFEGIFGANRTLAQNFAATMRGAFDAATNSFKSHLSALITGRESFGQALRGFVHEVTLNLAVESAPKAIFELAEGIASQASTFGVPNPKSVMHFTSAAMYAGLAVGGGVVAALTAPSPAANPVSGDAGGASPRLSGEFRGGGGGGGNTTNVFNFQSAIVTKEDAQDAVRRATQGAFNRGGRIEELAQIQRARAAA